MRNGSSRLIRDCTTACPSSARNSPATVPSAVEANSRRAIRAIISTASVPHTAAASRHANELSTPPPSRMPSAIIHLPTGGWTTYSGSVPSMLVSPASNRGLGSSPHDASYPRTSSENACLT